MQEAWIRSVGWKDPLEKGKATHSIPGQDGIYSPWARKESDTTEQLSLSSAFSSKWPNTSDKQL